MWALDFQTDLTVDGRQVRFLNIIDEYTREALATRPFRSCTADQLCAVLDDIITSTGRTPAHIRMDNGTEMTAHAMTDWCRFTGVDPSTWNLEEVPYPLEDASYDAVVMTEVFEHLRDYPVRSVIETRRILKPGGRLYFTTPNAAYVVNRFRALTGQSVATPLDDWIGGVPHARHAREYTFDEIRKVMDYAGMKIVSAQSRHFNLDSGRTGAAAALVKRGLAWTAVRRPTLGPMVVVVAERPQAN